MRRFLILFALAVSLATAVVARAAADDEARLMALLKSGGQVVLMRHTVTTPGVGDPPGMTLSDCSTQRNLTDEGRRHARIIGGKLLAAGIAFDQVVSSPLCRCKETAQLAFGRVDEMLPGTTRGDREVREMRAFAAEKRRGNVVLVSHGTTIRHAVSVDTVPGEMVVISPHGETGFEVRGKLLLSEP